MAHKNKMAVVEVLDFERKWVAHYSITSYIIHKNDLPVQLIFHKAPLTINGTILTDFSDVDDFEMCLFNGPLEVVRR